MACNTEHTKPWHHTSHWAAAVANNPVAAPTIPSSWTRGSSSGHVAGSVWGMGHQRRGLRQSVYWAGIDAEVDQKRCQCAVCDAHALSSPTEILLPTLPFQYPFQQVVTNLFLHRLHWQTLGMAWSRAPVRRCYQCTPYHRVSTVVQVLLHPRGAVMWRRNKPYQPGIYRLLRHLACMTEGLINTLPPVKWPCRGGSQVCQEDAMWQHCLKCISWHRRRCKGHHAVPQHAWLWSLTSPAAHRTSAAGTHTCGCIPLWDQRVMGVAANGSWPALGRVQPSGMTRQPITWRPLRLANGPASKTPAVASGIVPAPSWILRHSGST